MHHQEVAGTVFASKSNLSITIFASVTYYHKQQTASRHWSGTITRFNLRVEFDGMEWSQNFGTWTTRCSLHEAHACSVQYSEFWLTA